MSRSGVVVGRDCRAAAAVVRCLRVVDPADAVELPDELEPVRARRGTCGGPRRSRRSETSAARAAAVAAAGVLAVVAAGDERLSGAAVVGGELDPVDPEAARTTFARARSKMRSFASR
jgi:hypothetical protein